VNGTATKIQNPGGVQTLMDVFLEINCEFLNYELRITELGNVWNDRTVKLSSSDPLINADPLIDLFRKTCNLILATHNFFC
jgi:hypothetical protein